jgi:phage baseplate assembly protein gpV
MNRRLLLLLPALLAAALLPGPASRADDVPLTRMTGSVVSFDTDSQLLTVNTRVGSRQFVVSNLTQIFLNNRTSTTAQLVPGDPVTIEFNWVTSEARFVYITRQVTRKGTVAAATATRITLKLARGGSIALTTDDLSRVRVEGIPIDDFTILEGLKGTAVLQPGTFLTMSLQLQSNIARGTITALDPATRTVTIDGPRAGAYVFPDNATFWVEDEFVEFEDLVVGRPARIAYKAKRNGPRGLAIETF